MNQHDQVVCPAQGSLNGDFVERGFRWTRGTGKIDWVQDFPGGDDATRLGSAYFAARISSAMNAYCRALMALMAGSVAAMRFTSWHSSWPLLGLLPRTRISSCT
jgi:hypothetical protein